MAPIPYTDILVARAMGPSSNASAHSTFQALSDRIISRLIIVAKVWMKEFEKLLYAAGKGAFAIASTYLFCDLK